MYVKNWYTFVVHHMNMFITTMAAILQPAIVRAIHIVAQALDNEIA